MKERPILFSAPMVRAILEGRKTVTRRIMKIQNFEIDGGGNPFTQRWDESEGHAWRRDIICPYGQPGDQLWVRETWRPSRWHSGKFHTSLGIHYPADGSKVADERAAKLWTIDRNNKNRPSIHMPRWASRLSLWVIGVKVERLQDITEEQARAEGVDWDNWEDTDALNLTTCGTSYRNYVLESDADYPFDAARDSFQSLWESINGPESWAANPWVWCVSFQRVKP